MALEVLSPERAAEFLVGKGEGFAHSITDLASGVYSPMQGANKRSPPQGDHAASTSHAVHHEQSKQAGDADLKDWEIIRDALLSWKGPEREAIDIWRQLLCRRGFIMKWLNSCKGDGDVPCISYCALVPS